jgi:hypothetical protein
LIKTSLLKDFGIFAVIVVALFLFYGEMIFASKIPLFRDLGPFFYPMRYSLAEGFHSGELPWWDRHLAMGFPLLANFQTGAFYPPNLAYLLFTFLIALKINFILHSSIAALGAYLLARQWDYGRDAALIAALLFSLGGCMISMLNLLNHFQAAVWLPWLLLVTERQSLASGRCGTLFCVIVATLQFLAGSPEIYAMSMGLCLLNGLQRRVSGQTSLAPLFLLLKINLLVAGVSMVQVLPTLELLRETGRLRFASFEGVTAWSLHPGELLNLFLLDREVDTKSFDTFRSFTGLPAPFFMTVYMGALFPFGLWAWVLTRSGKERTVVLTGIVVSVVLSLGSFTPLYRWFYDYLPWVFMFRFPAKFFFVSFALFVYVTAAGVNAWMSERPSTARFLIGPGVLCGVFVTLDILLRCGEVFSPAWLWPTIGANRETASGIIMSVERQFLFGFSLAAPLWLWTRGKIRKTTVQILVVVVVLVDLCGAHRPYLFLTGQSVLSSKPTLLRYVEAESSERRLFFASAHSLLHPVAVLFPGARSPNEDIVFGIESLRPNAGRLWHVTYVQDMDALARDAYDLLRAEAQQLAPSQLYRLLGALNVSHLVSQQPLADDGISLVGHFPKYPLWLYRIERVVPRVYIVPHSVYEVEPSAVIRRLADVDFDPAQDVILEQRLTLKGHGIFNGVAKLTDHSQTRISIDVLLDQPGILILTDSFYPGWRVLVDGQEKQIMRANVFFRAVQLTAGAHRVDFRFEPASQKYGVTVSLIATGILVWLAARSKPHQGAG